MLFDVLLQAANGEQHGIAEVVVKSAGEVLHHDTLQVSQERFDGIIRRLARQLLPVFRTFRQGMALHQLLAVGKPQRLILPDAGGQLRLEGGKKAAHQCQRLIPLWTLLDEITQVSLNVGQLIAQVILVGLREVVNQLGDVEGL